jgi:hypothetical protein
VPQEKGDIIGESDPKHRTAFVPSARSRYAVADLQRVFCGFLGGLRFFFDCQRGNGSPPDFSLICSCRP